MMDSLKQRASWQRALSRARLCVLWFQACRETLHSPRVVLALLGTLLLAGGAHAGWTAYVSDDSGFNVSTTYANQRLIDFSTGTSTTTTNNTLTTEQTAGRLSFSTSMASGGSFSQTDTSSATGMSGKHVKFTSGTSGTASTMTVTFANGGTSYVAFDWYLGLKDQNGAAVTFHFSDGTSQTLYSCNSTSSNCLGAYVSTNWLQGLFNLLTLCLFGCNQYDTVYLTYIPSTGVKITSITFANNRCDGCGLLGLASLSQDMFVDNILYVDSTVAPHHLEVTTPSSSVVSGASVAYTVKSCADAACSTTYTTGMNGTLTVSGTGVTASPSSQAYTIGARSASTSVSSTLSGAGTATVALSAPSITPTGSPAVYCGIGVAAASGNSCGLTVLGLDHLEVTASSASGAINSAVAFTIQACANAACTVAYTGGVSGTFSMTGVAVSPSSSQAFSIANGSSTTSVSFTFTAAGTAVASISGVSPTPSGSTTLYCGLGGTASSSGSCSFTAYQTLHHVELTASTPVVTCVPITYTMKACGDSSCATPYTQGLSGALTVSGVTVNYPSGQTFTIASGSSSTTLTAHATTVGTATAALSGLSATATGSPGVWCGMGAAASSGGSCGVSTVQSALLFDVPNQVSDVQQSVVIKAVRASDNGQVCGAAFTGTRSIRFACSHVNPSSGYRAVRVGASSASLALNASANASAACDGSTQAVSLSFDSNGASSFAMRYADVGQVNMTASYTGSGSDAGLSLSASDSFIAAPASFSLSVPSSFVAGTAFSSTITALNSSGVATPNFGKESSAAGVTLSWAKYQPTGSGAQAGTFTGTGVGATLTGFSSGARTVSDLIWTEVGTGDLTATLKSADGTSSYLGTGLTATGSTGGSGGLGPFVPHHFDVVVTQGCGSSMTYSGQPFLVSVTARNAAGATTQNYDGSGITSPSFAKTVTLAPVSASSGGAITNASLSGSGFAAGVGSWSPVFTFTSKLTAPITSLALRATDTSGVSSSAGSEGAVTAMRSGRIKVSNAFGTNTKALDVPVQAQYWNGQAWVVNSLDSCTVVPAGAVALSGYVDYKGQATTAWTTSASGAVSLVSGNGTLTLSAPSSAGSGSVDFALNLGGSTTDASCLANHPSSSAGQISWLRSHNGSSNACAGTSTFDRDPSAKATFGVYQPETKKIVYTHDVF